MADYIPECEKSSCESINIILKSIGVEELALAKIIEAESEKLKAVIDAYHCPKMADEEYQRCCPVNVEALLKVNESIKEVLNAVIKKELVLLMKLDSTLDFIKDERKKCY